MTTDYAINIYGTMNRIRILPSIDNHWELQGGRVLMGECTKSSMLAMLDLGGEFICARSERVETTTIP
jgi:hypothetical protein